MTKAPKLQFDDMLISQEEQYSLGVERVTGRRYISVSVSQGFADYEEFFEISDEEFDRLLDDPEGGQDLARRCRSGEENARLFRRPGAL